MIKNFSILLDNFVVKHLYIYIEKKKIPKVIIQVNKMIHYWSFMKCWKPNNKNEKKKKDYYRDFETCNMIYHTFN